MVRVLFFLMIGRPPSSTLFPYTTLSRSARRAGLRGEIGLAEIDISNGERAAGMQVARDIDRNVFRYAAGGDASSEQHTAGVQSLDNDVLALAAVDGDGREAVGDGGA